MHTASLSGSLVSRQMSHHLWQEPPFSHLRARALGSELQSLRPKSRPTRARREEAVEWAGCSKLVPPRPQRNVAVPFEGESSRGSHSVSCHMARRLVGLPFPA